MTTARYRNRTAEVDAVQWTGSNTDELSAFCSPFDFMEVEPEDRVEDPDETAAVRESEHGTWRGLKPGDWVVRRGEEIYAVGAADFAKLYEPAAVPVPPPTDQTADRAVDSHSCGNCEGIDPATCLTRPKADSKPANRAALRDRIAAALYERERPPRDPHWPDVYAADREVFEAMADAVLAVLPEPTDRAAVEEMHTAWDALARCAREDADRLVELGRQAGLTLGEGRTVSVRTAIEAIGAELLRLAADRAAILTEAADEEGDELVCVDECGSCDACGMEPFGTPAEGWREAARFLRRTARDSGDRACALHGARLIEAELRRLAAEAQPTTRPEAQPESCAHCGNTIRRITGTLTAWWVHDPGGQAFCYPWQPADSPRATPQPAAEAQQQPDTETLAAMFEGLGRLLATSSRDWGQYAPDAWLYAVVLGWDCEETEHDETCTHGAMEEMAARHGWDDATVAKARRYRAAVRALTEPAAGARQDGAQQ